MFLNMSCAQVTYSVSSSTLGLCNPVLNIFYNNPLHRGRKLHAPEDVCTARGLHVITTAVVRIRFEMGST